jgi:exonuclease VII small subunit
MISIEQNMNELSRVSRELEQTSATLNSVLEKIDRGEGTLGKMLNDPSMYENLNSASARLDTLLMGINEDPGRYLKHMKIFEVF